jgi:hypothetical protein
MRFPVKACPVLIIALGLFTSCATGRLYLNSPEKNPSRPNESPAYTIYAVGDAGELNDQSKAVMARLSELASDDSQPGTVIFLGDNIYPAGFPPEENTNGQFNARQVLMNQITGLSSYNGNLIFIPGNHDWNEFKPGGLEAIKRQGDFLSKLNDPRIKMIPENGCGGPVTIELNDQIVMIILDSQWWLQKWADEKEMNAGCQNQTREDFIHAFQESLRENEGKQIIVTLHHPLYTQGAHGGHFTVRDHLFPLSKVVKWLYLPLPVIGSIYPYYRSIFGHSQDTKHRNYKAMREAILSAIDDEKEIIFLAGHDHNLQYLVEGNDHYLISGGGSKQNPISNSDQLIYGHKAAGFMQLDFFEKEGVLLTVYEVSPDSGSSKAVFSRFILHNINQ